jgi:hypothetical protein
VLLGAATPEEAADLALRCPDLAGAPPGQRRAWARWLYALYPPGPGGRLGSLQPDLLAEAHVAAQLGADPAVARSCLTGLRPDQADRALTVLARAWADHPSVPAMVGAALRDNLGQLAIPAARVALQTRPEIGAMLAAAVGAAPASLDTLTRMAEALPRPSGALAPARLAIAQAIRDALPADAPPADRGRWARELSGAYSALGRNADALPFAREAVASYRVLVSGCFSELGHFSAGHASRQARMQPPMSSAVAA